MDLHDFFTLGESARLVDYGDTSKLMELEESHDGQEGDSWVEHHSEHSASNHNDDNKKMNFEGNCCQESNP